jgi:hypothetical protein
LLVSFRFTPPTSWGEAALFQVSFCCAWGRVAAESLLGDPARGSYSGHALRARPLQQRRDLHPVREEAYCIGVHGVPTVTTHERVLYYGAASPGKVRTLLTSRKTIS